jgi:tRNA (guanine9-N1)-methyltransferase
VFTHEESVAEIWNTKNVVYLTSDSDNVLLQLDPKKIYVIGGLLDHNSHPGVSFAKAKQHGFGHARLPIGEYCKLNSRKVSLQWKS